MKTILKTTKRISPKAFVIVAFILVSITCILFYSIKVSSIPILKSVVFTLDEKLALPKCSLVGGFYKSPIIVSLSPANPDLEVYYTLDGTEPTSKSIKYKSPILITNQTDKPNRLSVIPTSPRWKPPIGNVFKGTILRAISVDKNNFRSSELIRSFFVDEKGNKRYTFPVVSITVNEKDLFGYEKGIYVLGKRFSDKDNYVQKNVPLYSPWFYYPANYTIRGENAERKGNLEFYEPSGQLGFETKVGIRINGNATRGFAQKSLRINFKEKDKAGINYPIFPSNEITKFNSIILRNSGNDWDKTMFRDAFMQSLIKSTHVDLQDFRPSIVFVNGEYWGIHNIRERQDEYYLANKYNLNPDSITILELTNSLKRGQMKSRAMFTELLQFLKKEDLSNDKNYEYIISKIDIESFIDFVIANVYFCNSDWPDNNVKFWRADSQKFDENSVAKDGKWRWMLYETDWGFGYTNRHVYNMDLLNNATIVGSVGVVFSSLMKNKSFATKFTSTFENYLNTIFKTEFVLKRIDEFDKLYSPEMSENINRWRVVGDMKKWKENVEELRVFAKKRPLIQITQLNSFLKLSGTDRITLK